MNTFELDARLLRDTCALCEWPLSRILLMNDARFPWLVLVPRVPSARDLVDLDDSQAAQLLNETRWASRALRSLFSPYKLNVAALGNVVEQLHMHVIARFTTDAAWPRPVWGVGTAEPYTRQQLDNLLPRLHAAFGTRN